MVDTIPELVSNVSFGQWLSSLSIHTFSSFIDDIDWGTRNNRL